MKKSYLTLKRILLALANTYLEKGDIVVYDAVAKTNNFTIYRGGSLVKTVTHSQVGVTALGHAGILEELRGEAPPSAAKPVTASLPVKAQKVTKAVKAPVAVGGDVLIAETPIPPNALHEYTTSQEVAALPYES